MEHLGQFTTSVKEKTQGLGRQTMRVAHHVNQPFKNTAKTATALAQGATSYVTNTIKNQLLNINADAGSDDGNNMQQASMMNVE